MEKYILDTSVFSNPDVYGQFDRDYPRAMRLFCELASRARAKFYMPNSVYTELQLVKPLGGTSADFERVVKLRSPRKSSIQIPSELLYEFIEEVRLRINRGLRIAEEATKVAGAGEIEAVGDVVKRLRDRFREAMRQGIIDSKEDADLLLLAFELDGTLVTADHGLRKWADKAGVSMINALNLRAILEGLAREIPA